MNFLKDHSKTNALVAILVFMISAIVYCLTMAPSICLWDCGEYLAASASLGIPHPPGTPMLVMFGRAWILFFSFFDDPGFRYNLMAVFGSSITVLFIYLIIVRSLIMALGEPDTLAKRLTIYCGGFVGSLFCAFSNTFWFESLEASEQANIANVPVIITCWLALVWAQSKDVNRDRILLLISFVSFAGIGVHMISFITAPAIFLFVILYDPAKRTDWRLWITGLALSVIMINLSWFVAAASSVLVASIIMLLVSKRDKSKWNFCFLFTLVAIIGFSNHIYLPIRSNLNPIIDEGHPTTWDSFKQVLDRKQYGSESMITRALWRRGDPGRQFGIEGHMGYGGFHLTQFFRFSFSDAEKNFVDGSAQGWGKLLIYLIPTLFMLLGWILLARRHKSVAAFLIIVTLLTTIIMAVYMNFADGTRAEHQDYLQWEQAGKPGQMPTVYREVRVRDYFYASGFMFFGMWMGISAGLVLTALFSSAVASRRRFAPFALILFAVSPALPLSQNYALRDRSGNWIPYEYAYNLLMSCEKDGILFTNGDNDTFPIWAIQEAYGIRRDVRLVNLSLVNTEWFVKQLKKVEPKVAVSYTPAEIDKLQPQLNPFETPTPFELPTTKLKVTLPDRKSHQVLRVQDMMVLNIVDANNWKKPVFFATSVTPDNFMGLDPYLKIQGLVYKLFKDTIPESSKFDVEKTLSLFDNVYKLRQHPERRTDVDEPYIGIATDYGICYQWLGMSLTQKMTAQQDSIKALEQKKALSKQDSLALKEIQAAFNANLTLAIENLDKCAKLIPWLVQPIAQRHQILMNFNKPDMAEKRARDLIKLDPTEKEYYYMLVQALQAQGKQKEVDEIMKKIPASAKEG